MVERVTDPAKIVTDDLMLRELGRQGIDPNYVEFWHDCAPRSEGKEYSPYAKFYRDLKSNKRFMVVSGLPKVKPNGQKIEVGWLYADGKYHTKPNLFSATVNGKQITITCLSDQPPTRGHIRKAGDGVTYSPQLFFNNVELLCNPEPLLLPTDPINENYKENTLEWEYGADKHRIRVIEGRIRDKWLVHLRGIYEIEHNPSGNLPLRYGHCIRADGESIAIQVIGSREIVDTRNLPDSAFPVEIGASPETFYPDEGVNSVDGLVAWIGDANGVAWSTVVANNGTNSWDNLTGDLGIRFLSGGMENYFQVNRRSVFVFDTSGLPDTHTITAATMSIYGYGKVDDLVATPDVNIYSHATVSATALEPADYNVAKWGGTAFCDTTITYANWDTAGYNDFVFNATGLAAISKTSATKIGARNVNYDVAGSQPPWLNTEDSGLQLYWAEQGTDFKPKLVVTYTFIITAATAVGVAVSATRTIALSFTPSVAVGVALSVSRIYGAVRSANNAVGVAVSASRILGIVRTASVAVGVSLSVGVIWKWIKLNLQNRVFSFILQRKRRIAFTLKSRSKSLTLPKGR